MPSEAETSAEDDAKGPPGHAARDDEKAGLGISNIHL